MREGGVREEREKDRGGGERD
jgi:hypothetical protein